MLRVQDSSPLKNSTSPFDPAIVEFDGCQGGALIQFPIIGNVSLVAEQTAGGHGSSDPGAKCTATFLD